MINTLIMSYSAMWHANSVNVITLIFSCLLILASIIGAIMLIVWTLIISNRCNLKTVTFRSIACLGLLAVGMIFMASFRMEETTQLNNGVISNVGCYYKIKSYNKRIKRIPIKEHRTRTYRDHKGILWIQDTHHNRKMLEKRRKLIKEREPYEKAYRDPSHKYNGTDRIHLKKFHLLQI